MCNLGTVPNLHRAIGACPQIAQSGILNKAQYTFLFSYVMFETKGGSEWTQREQEK